MQLKQRLRLVAMLALLPFGSAQPARAADSIALRFAWPDGVVLRVERFFEREEIREPGPVPDKVRSATRFKWTGTSSEAGYRVVFSDFAVVHEEPQPRSSDAVVQLEYTSRAVEPLLPTLVVDDAGQPVELDGVAELRKRVLASYESIPRIDEDAHAKQLVEVLTSDEMLTQRALEDWNRMVQVWHGVDGKIGDVKEIRGSTSAAAPGSPVDNVFSYSLERRLPCVPDGSAPFCVRLVAAQVPEFTDARAASRLLLGFDFESALGAPPTASLDVTNTFTTDTDPATLLPSRYVKEKRWSVSWVDADGQPRKLGRTDRWTYIFSRVESAPAK